MSIKPGKNDKKYGLLVQGDELKALHNITHCFCECFGLDTRISNYKGKRAIGLYQWDFECLLEGIFHIINNKKEIPWVNANDRTILTKLYQRIKGIYEETYGAE